MSHTHHPAIADHGLQDGCPRCGEIANDPFVGLDDDNLLLLVARTRAWMRDCEYPRSITELKAMRLVETTLRHIDRLRYIDDKQRSAGLEQQDMFSRKVPRTPAYGCNPDPSCGQDSAA